MDDEYDSVLPDLSEAAGPHGDIAKAGIGENDSISDNAFDGCLDHGDTGVTSEQDDRVELILCW